jgi:protein ImuB
MMTAVRTLVLWCHDWPVAAAGFTPDDPVAVVHANRVTVASVAARADGVAIGLRRREAQARCPALVVLEPDPARDARAFEPVVAALDALTPRIEVAVPGSCAFATLGPSRYFGGDDALATRALALAAGVLAGRTPCQVGIADGPFAARLAATGGGVVVPPGESAAFLAPLPVGVLAPPELVDVLVRLGLTTLGDLAAVPAASVVGRFGVDGSRAHRLARGLDERPPAARIPAPDFAVQAELDPPAERVDAAAFMAKVLADELHQRLAADGLACTRLLVVAETEHGERLERLWRDEGALTPGAIADRTRWQLDGWLNGSAHARPTAGITLLRLAPDEVVPARGRQLGFWGGVAEAGERAARALARVEGLLGPGAVTVAECRGGRGPAEQVTLVPVGAVDLASPRPAARPDWVGEPWPGRLPSPSPALVPVEAVPARLVDAAGEPVGVTGRGVLTAEPAALVVREGEPVAVEAWAGPWPADERWWDPAGHRRRARLQVVTVDGSARLVTLEAGQWTVEAIYD